ncbi:hypothetical protein GCM10026982_54710 [Nocardiopsis aegyptia]
MAQKVHKQWVPFGHEVRRNRSELGLSQPELGKLIQVSGGMVGHIERAVRVATRDQVDAMEAVFTTDGALLRMWSEILKYRSVPDWFQNALSTERRADLVHQYQSILVPGLLQTPFKPPRMPKCWSGHGNRVCPMKRWSGSSKPARGDCRHWSTVSRRYGL